MAGRRQEVDMGRRTVGSVSVTATCLVIIAVSVASSGFAAGRLSMLPFLVTMVGTQRP
jgi:hypothetical protein